MTADKNVGSEPRVDEDLGASREGSRTGILELLPRMLEIPCMTLCSTSRLNSCVDDELAQKEEERIRLDDLSPAQFKELKLKAENHAFQAEVSRMMKLIINSLYKNKDVRRQH